MKAELTFERICELEPEVERLYATVKGSAVGANLDYLWENLWRPRIEQLVGPNSRHPLLRSETANRIVSEKLWETLGTAPGT